MKYLVIISLILGMSSLGAQMTFEKTYGGEEDDEGNAVIQTQDGGYLIAGYTRSHGNGLADVYIVKTDAAGDTAWTRTYGGAGWDRASAVMEMADGNYLIAGTTDVSTEKRDDVYLLKVDAGGDTVWTKTYGGTHYQRIDGMARTYDGGYVLCGAWDAGYDDFYLMKIDSEGDSLWAHNYGNGGSTREWAYAVAQTADSGFILTGYGPGPGEKAVFVVRTDAGGKVLWTNHYDGYAGHDIVQNPDGSYLIVGHIYSFTSGDDIYLIRLSASGDTVWTKRYGSLTNDQAQGVVRTSDGGYMITGYAGGLDVGSRDAFIMKTDSLGEQIWIHGYGSTSTDMGYNIKSTDDGGYVITGYREGYPVSAHDVYLIKTDADGMVMTIPPDETGLPAGFCLYPNYPDPFNSRTAITFSLPQAVDISLTVYDVTGRNIDQLYQGKKQRGTYTLVWDARDIASGIYFIRLITATITLTEKCLYVK